MAQNDFYTDFSSLQIPESVKYHKIIKFSNEQSDSFSNEIDSVFSDLSSNYNISDEIKNDCIDFINKYLFQVSNSNFLSNNIEVDYLIFIEDRDDVSFFKGIVALKKKRAKFDIFYSIFDDKLICIVRNVIFRNII